MSFTTILTSVAILALGAAQPASADVRVSSDRHAAFPSAFADNLVWSTGPPTGPRFHLVERVGGRVFRAPVRPGPEGFDADLGANPIGAPVAVYPHCGVPPRRLDCDLEALDLTTAMTYSPSGGSSAACSERSPSVWGETVAFVRLANPNGHCREGLWVARPGAAPQRISRRFAQATDLRGHFLAAAHMRARRDGTATRIVLYNLSTGRSTVVATGYADNEGRGVVLADPVIDGDTLYWLADEGRSRQRVVGVPIGPNGREVVTGYRRMHSFTVDAGRILYAFEGVFRLGASPAAAVARCRTPELLGTGTGFVDFDHRRGLQVRATGCNDARRVARGWARDCYRTQWVGAAETCEIQTRRGWTCRRRVLSPGDLSRVTCRSIGRGRVVLHAFSTWPE
jgi:hypothetical protein